MSAHHVATAQSSAERRAQRRARMRKAGRRGRLRRFHIFGITIALVVVGGIAAIALTSTGDGSTSTGTGARAGMNHGKLPKGLELTGTNGPMGGPLLVTPGSKSGTSTASGVTVDGANLKMGHIPLMYAVNPSWTLRNTSAAPVTFGKPKLSIVKGCCPGDLTLGTSTLVPGASTTLQFPLQMHEGMDGYHDFRIAVPVNGTDESLQLSVTGDFT